MNVSECLHFSYVSRKSVRNIIHMCTYTFVIKMSNYSLVIITPVVTKENYLKLKYFRENTSYEYIERRFVTNSEACVLLDSRRIVTLCA